MADEDVVEVMGDAAGEGAQGFQLLRANLRLLGALEFGEVGVDLEDAGGLALSVKMENQVAGDDNAPAVAGFVNKFAVPDAVAAQSLLDLGRGCLELSLQEFVGNPADGVLAGEAEEFLGTTSPEDDAVLQIANEDRSEVEETES